MVFPEWPTLQCIQLLLCAAARYMVPYFPIHSCVPSSPPVFTGFLEMDSQSIGGLLMSDSMGNAFKSGIYIPDLLSQNVIHISTPTAMGETCFSVELLHPQDLIWI